VFRLAGAEVYEIGTAPDGLNINDGYGSTHLDPLRAAVRERGADLGIAHDGDADRCLAVDHEGNEVDGDQILAVLALDMRERGVLRSDTVVATVMSNLGFKLALEREGLRLVQTAVGDRYVLEEMKQHGYALGGEQSGHVIVLDHATTGDGTLTGLLLAARIARTGRTLKDLAGVMERLPQVLINVPDVDRTRVGTSAELATAVADAERELGSTGRVLLRPSGTEPLVRVMVEAADIEQARSVAGRLADAVKSALG
jgi:phosphoglucosamine mutase